MPSLFSRARTNSTPRKQHSFVALDEFGRINSRLSAESSSRKKSKARPQSPDVPPPIPDGSFLPLSLQPTKITSDHYGYLSYQRHVVLGLDDVARLVAVIADELATRGGITTPFIFSTTALDISSSAIKKLIHAFLATCANPSPDAEARWRDEARFAGPHELGMCLRWGLARVIRSVGGQDVRGLLSWDRYVEFRDSEAAQGYPPAHFATLLKDLNPTLQSVLVTLLTLLSRLTANSTSSGHTPPTLSPLFGPLIFGLGPATLAFHHTYTHYLRAVNAMEHLQLVFIRWQDCPATGSAVALGVPVRLKEWIKGYPAMLPFLQDPASSKKTQARRGVRTVRVMSVRRNVRMYSPDLVKTAASWAHRPDSLSGPTKNGLLVSKEWARVAPPTLKLSPRYSDAYKKRMNMPSNFHPDTGVLSAPGLNTASSVSSYGSSLTTSSDTDYFGLGLGLGLDTRTGDDRFRSLTDLKWGEFESMGFSNLEDEKKLQFDLTESARTERHAKRESLSWTDFSTTGFTRSDAPLSATLQFSTPVAKTISSWPAHNAEIAKKLKKTEKALPPFGWDTEPVVVNEEVIEEPFIDVFCDLVYGGGWMDIERSEELDRDCNWALVEFKALPVNRTTTSGGSDPRTSTTLILFEEFVPLEYRQQLAIPPSTRRRLPSLFSSSSSSSSSYSYSHSYSPLKSKSKSKQWKQAPTLNGRPYVVGHVPHSPTYREVEFEEILRGGAETKVIRLGHKSIKVPPPSRVSIPPEIPLGVEGLGESLPLPVPLPVEGKSGISISGPLYAPPPVPPVVVVSEYPTPAPAPAPAPKSDEVHSDSTLSNSMTSSTKRSSRFRIPVSVSVSVPSPGRKPHMGMGMGMQPAEYSTVEFETRLTSCSDDDDGEDEDGCGGKGWVDIVVGKGKDGERGKDGNGERGGKGEGDPDMASREVERVLAGVRSSYSMEGSGSGEGGVERRVSQESEYTNEVSVEPEPEEEVREEETKILPVTATATARLLAKTQRRMGYFDLHPERRPGSSGGGQVEETRLAYEADREDGEEDEDDDKPLASLRPLPLRKLPVPPAPAPVLVEPTKVEIPKPPVVVGPPLKPVSVNGHSATAAAAAAVPMSKTAALIEMYRERERATSPNPVASASASVSTAAPVPAPVSPVQPSRLPVRPSLVKEAGGGGGGGVQAPVPAATIVAPTPRLASLSPAPSPSEPLNSSSTLIEPPRIVIEETGRASPGRYVHGAPLHNVMEEEEEE